MHLISMIRRWLPAVVVMGLIFIASSIPSEKMPDAGQWDSILKKGGHMSGYALLALAIMRGRRGQSKKDYLLTTAACLLYAFSDELHQSVVPGRNPALFDIGFDITGSGIALLAFARFPALNRLVYAFIEPG